MIIFCQCRQTLDKISVMQELCKSESLSAVRIELLVFFVRDVVNIVFFLFIGSVYWYWRASCFKLKIKIMFA